MDFTDADRAKRHADRKAGWQGDDDGIHKPVCGHCSNPFPASQGVVTDDFSLCDVCNGD